MNTNLLDSDNEEDEAEKYSFYEKEALKSNQPYEEYFDKLNIFLNQYMDKTNELLINTEALDQSTDNIAVNYHETVNKFNNEIFYKRNSTFLVAYIYINWMLHIFLCMQWCDCIFATHFFVVGEISNSH